MGVAKEAAEPEANEEVEEVEQEDFKQETKSPKHNIDKLIDISLSSSKILNIPGHYHK